MNRIQILSIVAIVFVSPSFLPAQTAQNQFIPLTPAVTHPVAPNQFDEGHVQNDRDRSVLWHQQPVNERLTTQAFSRHHTVPSQLESNRRNFALRKSINSNSSSEQITSSNWQDFEVNPTAQKQTQEENWRHQEDQEDQARSLAHDALPQNENANDLAANNIAPDEFSAEQLSPESPISRGNESASIDSTTDDASTKSLVPAEPFNSSQQEYLDVHDSIADNTTQNKEEDWLESAQTEPQTESVAAIPTSELVEPSLPSHQQKALAQTSIEPQHSIDPQPSTGLQPSVQAQPSFNGQPPSLDTFALAPTESFQFGYGKTNPKTLAPAPKFGGTPQIHGLNRIATGEEIAFGNDIEDYTPNVTPLQNINSDSGQGAVQRLTVDGRTHSPSEIAPPKTMGDKRDLFPAIQDDLAETKGRRSAETYSVNDQLMPEETNSAVTSSANATTASIGANLTGDQSLQTAATPQQRTKKRKAAGAWWMWAPLLLIPLIGWWYVRRAFYKSKIDFESWRYEKSPYEISMADQADSNPGEKKNFKSKDLAFSVDEEPHVQDLNIVENERSAVTEAVNENESLGLESSELSQAKLDTDSEIAAIMSDLDFKSNQSSKINGIEIHDPSDAESTDQKATGDLSSTLPSTTTSTTDSLGNAEQDDYQYGTFARESAGDHSTESKKISSVDKHSQELFDVEIKGEDRTFQAATNADDSASTESNLGFQSESVDDALTATDGEQEYSESIQSEDYEYESLTNEATETEDSTDNQIEPLKLLAESTNTEQPEATSNDELATTGMSGMGDTNGQSLDEPKDSATDQLDAETFGSVHSAETTWTEELETAAEKSTLDEGVAPYDVMELGASSSSIQNDSSSELYSEAAAESLLSSELDASASDKQDSNELAYEASGAPDSQNSVSDERPVRRIKLDAFPDESNEIAPSNAELKDASKSSASKSMREDENESKSLTTAQTNGIGSKEEGTESLGNIGLFSPNLSGQHDDFTRLDGINLEAQNALYQAGFFKYQDLKYANNRDLKSALAETELKFSKSQFRNLKLKAAEACRDGWSNDQLSNLNSNRASQSKPETGESLIDSTLNASQLESSLELQESETTESESTNTSTNTSTTKNQDGKAKSTGERKTNLRTAADYSSMEPDDLKKIRGIGPVTEEFLNENGIRRFEQIAEMTSQELSSLFENAKRRFRLQKTETWPEQALAFSREREDSKIETEIMDEIKSISAIGNSSTPIPTQPHSIN